jgi:hypothetical protein
LLSALVLADDKFRANFLWGRRPMLAACAARLRERNDLVWVDLGAGTGVSAAALITADCSAPAELALLAPGEGCTVTYKST